MADDGDLVTVYETDARERIAMAEYALSEAGIPYIATNSTISVVYPVDGMAIVRFQVCQADAERALAVIERLKFEGRRPSTGVERAVEAVRSIGSGEPDPGALAEAEDAGDRAAGARPGPGQIRLRLDIGATEARARLRNALASAGGPVRGSWSDDEFDLSTSSLLAGHVRCRGRITPRGAGSELECTPAAGLLHWLVVPVGLVVAVLYLLRQRPSGTRSMVRLGGPLGPALVAVSILVLAILASLAIARRRQSARLRDFLNEVFEDVLRPEPAGGTGEA